MAHTEVACIGAILKLSGGGGGECLCALAGFRGYIVMLRARMFRSLIPVLISYSDQRTEYSCA